MLFKVFYTDSNLFINRQSAGCARSMFVFIRPKYKNDTGILAHELVHVKQFWKNPLFHGWMYLLSRHYRFNAEVEAYREQIKHYPDDRSEKFAEIISEYYKLDVSKEEALAALKA